MSAETWTGITADNEEARKRRQTAYDCWFHICTCGHGPDDHSAAEPCDVEGCGCVGYDHITGKPDHPCNRLPADDPRAASLPPDPEEGAPKVLVRNPDGEDAWLTGEQVSELLRFQALSHARAVIDSEAPDAEQGEAT